MLNLTKDPTWLNHSLDDRDMISPLVKLKDNNGIILFLGTDFHTCTSVHLTEHYSKYAKLNRFDCEIKNSLGKIQVVETCTFELDDKIVDNFAKISDLYLKKYTNTKYYKRVQIGLATATLIDAKKLYDIAYDFHKEYKVVAKT